MKSLVRFSPSGELRNMQREIDRLFEDFFAFKGAGHGNGARSAWSPLVDMTESDEAYVLHVDTPGMAKDAFEIDWQDNVLTVSGERKERSQEENERFVRTERATGRFRRSFRLPNAVDGERISASYDAGVLTVRVPKTEQSRPRRIAIP